MSTATLPFPPIVGAHDPDTSRQAAKADRSSLRSIVHSILASHPDGLTDWELWDLTGLGVEHKPSVVNRRRECHAVPTGERRPSPSGRACEVWTLPGVTL